MRLNHSVRNKSGRFTQLLKHTTTLFSLSDHYILSREWRIIVDQVQTNYHGRPVVLYSIRCDRAVDYEGSPLSGDYGRICFNSVKTLGALHS